MNDDGFKLEHLHIRELKPCSVCGGPLKGGVFRIVTVQFAAVNRRRANAFLGTMQITGSPAIAAVLAGDDAVDVLTNEEATARIFVCVDCFARKWCLGEVLERHALSESKETG